jgi:two-component system response regulator HydG
MGEPLDGGDGTATVARPRGATEQLAPSACYRLTVTEGPDRGLTFVVDGTSPSRMLVGQSPACAVRLSDRQASRRHLALDLEERRLHVVDLGSTNGTRVNGVTVRDAFLEGGDKLRLGATALSVEVIAEATAIAVSERAGFGRIVGASLEMRKLYPLCERLAAASVTVILEGETGTGKELLAEALHEEGPRANGPFVVFDCTAIPANLLESDLFGHERGAFTGALATRKGVFEQAHGGTLLIDEIGDLELALQPKLLRAIERSEVRRVGGNEPIRVDVRVLCATRRDLDHEVQQGRFRDDLFHRLAVARIELPPLRRRQGDVELLARVFWREHGGDESEFGDAMLARWTDYDWPGNVRELRNAVARHLALGDLADADVEAVASGLPPVPSPGAEGILERVLAMGLPYNSARQRLIREFERCFVERVLAAHGGNVLRAALASGIARRQLQRVKARIRK